MLLYLLVLVGLKIKKNLKNTLTNVYKVYTET